MTPNVFKDMQYQVPSTSGKANTVEPLQKALWQFLTRLNTLHLFTIILFGISPKA